MTTGQPDVEWNVLLYLAADNDLSRLAKKTLDIIAAAGGSDRVRIVVQMDAEKEPTSRYIFGPQTDPNLPGGPGKLRDAGPNGPSGLAPGTQVNTGAPQSLTDFLRWARQFPAGKTALVIWNHGGGTLGLDTGRGPGQGVRGDFLTNREFREAFEALERDRNRAPGGPPIDVLVCDACLTGTVELANEVRDQTRYFVAPETNTPADGLPYPAILADLKAAPEMGPEQLAERIVGHSPETDTAVLAAWRQEAMRPLQEAIDELGATLAACVDASDDRHLTAIRDRVISMEDPDYVDLGSLLSRLSELEKPPRLREVAQRCQRRLEAARLAVGPAGRVAGDRGGLSGLSILFPGPDSYWVKRRSMTRDGSGPTGPGAPLPRNARLPRDTFRSIVVGLRGAPNWETFLASRLPPDVRALLQTSA